MSEKKGNTGGIKKYVVLTVICILSFTSLWLIFNEFQVRSTTSTAEFSRSHVPGLNLRTLLLFSPFLLALIIMSKLKLSIPSTLKETVRVNVT
jgi:hypothetical protein